MLRFIAIFTLLLQISLFAQNTPFEEYKTTLLSVDKNEGVGTIADSDKIVIGASGIVMHKFDADKNTIIARAVVIKKDGTNATVKFEVFDMLEQAAFPIPGIVPNDGDTVTLNYLYKRALIIAPNETIFNEITNHFSDIEWVHPDIMAAYLAADYNPSPGRNSFDVMCRKNTTGLVFFALQGHGYFADCQSLKILKTYNSGDIAEYQLPFYNRIGGIDTVFWKWGNSHMDDYNEYYERLLDRYND